MVEKTEPKQRNFTLILFGRIISLMGLIYGATHSDAQAFAWNAIFLGVISAWIYFAIRGDENFGDDNFDRFGVSLLAALLLLGWLWAFIALVRAII